MSEEVENSILKRYEILQQRGRGSYGTVWKARDKETGDVVALKKIPNAFQNREDALAICRQIMFLRELNGHENIVRLHDVFRSENGQDIYLTLDYMKSDVHACIRAGILEDAHKQFIVYQLLCALKYMHAGEVVNCDLKPSNILINSDCQVKIANFFKAITTQETANNSYSPDFVVTRWYKAPEELCGCTQYSTAMDMWSLGCIAGEMIAGRPIFPGTSTLNQLDFVMVLTGRPSQEDIESMQSSLTKSMLDSISPSQRRPFSLFFPKADDIAIDFIRNLLQFNPNKRLTAEQALEHPYVAQFRTPEDESVCQHIVKIPIDNVSNLSAREYRERLFSDVTSRKTQQEQEIDK